MIALAACCAGPLTACSPSAPVGENPPLRVAGRTGAGPAEFNYPRAIAVARDGGVFVVDKGGRIQHFTADGEFVGAWRTPAIDAGKPTGVGVAPDGRLFVADTHYARILIYSPSGELIRTFGEYGDGPGRFRLPTDVLVRPDGSFYVSEYGGNDRVSHYTADFAYISSFGGADAGEARLARPQSLALSPEGDLWVADACNHRICRFSADGEFRAAFGRLGSGHGELRFPYGVTVLSDGTLVVTEYGNNRVQRFTPEGVSLGVWGAAGRSPGRLAYPWAAAALPDDRVVIVDSGNNRLQWIAGRRSTTWSIPGPPRATVVSK
ncbi:MAG: hypothetical protein D6744_04865 [Planctomycetota bacterium]|nr:MAG: hypothetical protein D6744_04865 [Planctomycetota bacterium]